MLPEKIMMTKAFDTKSGLHATNFKLIVILEKS